MHVLVLLALIAVGFTLDQTWNRHRVRAYYAALGRRVLEIRWRPFGAFSSSTRQRGDSVYHVIHAGTDGAVRASCCVIGCFAGVRLDEDLGARSGGGFAAASRRASSRPHNPAFWVACAATALVSWLAIGATYWTAPYGALNLPDALYVVGFALVPGGALALALWEPRRFLVIVGAQTAAVVAVVAVRIAADLARDPTTHNLFPFEIAIAIFVGGIAAGCGAGIGRLARRFVTPASTRAT